MRAFFSPSDLDKAARSCYYAEALFLIDSACTPARPGADGPILMKTGIHPEYHQIKVSCACGNTFEVGSTMKDDLRVEICANCHPLYTGKSKLIDTTGRVDRFQARVQKAQAFKGQVETKSETTEEKAA